MKILVVAHDSNFSGGANRSLYMVLTRLIKDYNVDVDVLVPKKKGQLNDRLSVAGIRWFSHRYFGVVSGIRNDGKDILRYGKIYVGYFLEKALALRLKAELAGKNYDLVYTNTRLPFVGAELARLIGVPHVCHVREFGTVKPLWGFYDYRKIYDMSAKIILISKALKNKFAEYVPEDKLIAIHNGIDYPADTECVFNKEKDSFDILLTGRLVPDKGHKDAIYAMKELKEQGYASLHLHIVGSSPSRTHIEWYEREIKALVKELELEDCITFHGEVNDMPAIRKKMDVELMCAICETFGRVTVEAMRSGLAVIGSDTGATPELVDDGKTGLLYRQGDPSDLASKIRFLFENRDEMSRLAKNGYEFAKVNFTPELNVRQIYSVLEEVIR